MNNNDRFEDMEKIVHDHAYTGSEPETAAFSFATDYIKDGRVSIGDGSDKNPFVVGITTKRLLGRLNIPAQTFIFHLDATYKTNQLGYHVLVCGVSDRVGEYFMAQWLIGRFQRWQCFYTPIGFASTNNPAEQFNRVLKRDYTLRTRPKLGTLLLQLLTYCGHDSERCRGFRNVIEVNTSLKRRVVELKKAGSLYEVLPGPESGLEHLAHAGLKFVVTKKTERMFVPWKNCIEEGIAVSAPLGTNYARMEIEGQPEWGWCVNLHQQTCGCGYFFKFGQCIRLLFAMQKRGFPSVTGKRTMVYRGSSKRRREREDPDACTTSPLPHAVPPGRPQNNAHALAFQ